MSKWQRTLDLTDVWNKSRNKEITTLELATVIVERLNNLKPFNNLVDGVTEDIIDYFKEYIDNKENNIEEFDDIMSELYDWGDISLDKGFFTSKVCWIETG